MCIHVLSRKIHNIFFVLKWLKPLIILDNIDTNMKVCRGKGKFFISVTTRLNVNISFQDVILTFSDKHGVSPVSQDCVFWINSFDLVYRKYRHYYNIWKMWRVRSQFWDLFMYILSFFYLTERRMYATWYFWYIQFH